MSFRSPRPKRPYTAPHGQTDRAYARAGRGAAGAIGALAGVLPAGGGGARSTAVLGVDRSGRASHGCLGCDRLGDCRYPLGAVPCCSFGISRPLEPAEAAAPAGRGTGIPTPPKIRKTTAGGISHEPSS